MQLTYENAHPTVSKSAFVAPTAVIVGNASIADHASIWFHCVIRADINRIEIGQSTNIQDGCLLHVTNRHPLIVGERVTVGHGAILHGCHIESNCLISMGAIVLDGAVIGHGSIVAAGCVVPPGMRVPPNSLLMGVPAKVVREVTAEDLSKVEKGWQNYKRYALAYKEMQLPDNSGD